MCMCVYVEGVGALSEGNLLLDIYICRYEKLANFDNFSLVWWTR